MIARLLLRSHLVASFRSRPRALIRPAMQISVRPIVSSFRYRAFSSIPPTPPPSPIPPSDLDDEFDEAISGSGKSLAELIETATVEAAWRKFMETWNADKAQDIPVKNLLQLLTALTSRHSVQNNESRKRILLVSELARKHPLSAQEYNALVFALAGGNMFHECLDLLDDMRRLQIDVEDNSLKRVIWRGTAAKESALILPLCNKYFNNTPQTSPLILSALIKGFTRAGNMESACAAFEAKKKTAGGVRSSDYRSIIFGYFDKEDLEAVKEWELKFVADGLKPTLVTAGAFLYGYSRFSLEESYRWFEYHKTIEVPPDVDSEAQILFIYNSWLYAQSKFGMVDDAIVLFREMCKQGPKPDKSTFHILMDAFVKLNDISSAFKLLDMMKERSLQLTAIPYSILINGCVRSRDVAGALQVMDEMNEVGVAPNTVTYSTLINMYCKTGQITLALEIYKFIKTSGLPLDIKACGTILLGAAKASLFEDVLDIYNDVETHKLDVNEYIYSALIFACAKREDVSGAKSFFEEMQTKNIPVNVFAYNALMAAHSKARDPESGYKLLEEMKSRNICPNLGTYNLLMDLASIEGRYDSVLKFFHLLVRDENLEFIDGKTVGNVVRILGREKSNVETIISTFKALLHAEKYQKVKIDPVAWLTYIQVLAKSEYYKEAQEAIKDMLGKFPADMVPQRMLNEILAIFKRNGQFEELDQILDMVEKCQMNPIPAPDLYGVASDRARGGQLFDKLLNGLMQQESAAANDTLLNVSKHQEAAAANDASAEVRAET